MTKFLNRPLTLMLCFLMVFSLILPTFADVPSNDYESSWAKETIQSAIDSGVVKGYPDGSFKPNNAITRAAFFSLINNVFNFTVVHKPRTSSGKPQNPFQLELVHILRESY